MASVSVEFQAFHDPRFKVLAKLSGLTWFDAIGRMAAIWAFSIERNTSTLERLLVDALAEIDGYTELAIQAGLIDAVDEATVRIKGTEGRIEWLAKARARQRQATEAATQKRVQARCPKSDPILDPTSVSNVGSPLVSSSASSSAPASTSKKKSLVDPSDTTRLWKLFEAELNAKGIEAVHEGAKSNTQLNRLVKAYGLQKAEQLVKAFISDNDPFIRDKAWSLGHLVSQQQKYLARLATQRTKSNLDFGTGE